MQLRVHNDARLTLRYMQFQVYSGRSQDEIDELYRNGASSWCSSSLSWDSWFVKGYRKCEVTISPFGETIVTVVPEDAVIKQKKLSCSQAERSELSLQLLVSGLAGLVLFYTAPHLATSVAFRVSVGGTLSVFLCSLIIAVYFFRSASSLVCVAADIHWWRAVLHQCPSCRRMRCICDTRIMHPKLHTRAWNADV